MANGKKFTFDLDPENITDVDPVEINEDNREIDGTEVNEIIEEHAEQAVPDPTNSGNFDHPDPEVVEPEIVTDDPKEKKAALMINGKMLIFMIDIVVPLIIKYGSESANKNIEVDIDALKMDEEDKELLGPSAEHVAEIIFGNLGPVPQFLIGISVIYASKVPDAIKKKSKDDSDK